MTVLFREEFEPCSFFKYKPGGERVWLTRQDIRRLEVALKNRFLEWLEINPERVNKVLHQIGRNVQSELKFRSKPFDQVCLNYFCTVSDVLFCRSLLRDTLRNNTTALMSTDGKRRVLEKTVFVFHFMLNFTGGLYLKTKCFSGID